VGKEGLMPKTTRVICQQLGYALAAADPVAALALVLRPADIGDLKIEATLIVVLVAAVAGWLIVVE
jgi:hypothetical protein